MKLLNLLHFTGVLLLPALAGSPATAKVVRDATGVSVTTSGQVTRVEFWDEDVVRVTRAKGDQLPEISSLVVINEPQRIKFTTAEDSRNVLLGTSKLKVQINVADGAVRFSDADGNLLLGEANNGCSIERHEIGSTGSYRIQQSFDVPSNQAFYGLGQHQQGVMNWRGHKSHLQQRNAEVGVPVLLSSAGYAILWDNPAVTDVDVAPSDSTQLKWDSEAGRAVDYYFCGGSNPDAALAAYRRLTGTAPMFPKWAWGFWQCKERYATQSELLDVLNGYRERKIPLDGIIQDWQYWAPGQWGSHEFDPIRYPDPEAMVERIHQRGAHAIVSVWPRFDEGTQHHLELEEANAIYPPLYPNVWPRGFGKWYDPFSEAGRQLYWRQIFERLGKIGFDGWWLDASEAELGGKWGQMRDLDTAAGPGAEVFNAYPLMHTTAVYEGHRQDLPEKRAILLTRSAFAGQQRNAAVTWSGDIKGEWETFARQIPAGLNFVATGIPYWNTDIGGFFGGDPEDPAYAELFTRWFQFGAFCSMFRVHGTGKGKEVWRFDAATQEILTDYIRLRYRLLPYIYSTSWMVTSNGYSMMRPLVLDFQHDQKVFDIDDQYMFGPSIMVNPVVRKGATVRDVYLPNCDAKPQAPGTTWIDFWTGQGHSPGASIEASAPIEVTPLYVRAGSIIPLGPDVEFASEQEGPIELRVYRGADGEFTLYEDEGDGYGYEDGRYATIPVRWNERTHTLVIGERQGEFPRMLRERTFRVVWVSPGHGVGVNLTHAPDTEVTYRGSAVTVSAPQN